MTYIESVTGVTERYSPPNTPRNGCNGVTVTDSPATIEEMAVGRDRIECELRQLEDALVFATNPDVAMRLALMIESRRIELTQVCQS